MEGNGSRSREIEGCSDGSKNSYRIINDSEEDMRKKYKPLFSLCNVLERVDKPTKTEWDYNFIFN